MNINKKEDISIQDFTKLDIVLGTILKASKNQKANLPAYILTIDFGKIIGIKSTSAQITNYSLDELIGKQVVGICNLPAKNIAGFVSEVLVLGAVVGKEISLLQADKNLENGTLIG
jgi:tRNA-binding protein